MPDLQPLNPGTETLTAVAVGTETLGLIAVGTETLGPLDTDYYGFQYLLPDDVTYPSATTYPGIYGEIVGLALTSLPEGGETLTPLMED